MRALFVGDEGRYRAMIEGSDPLPGCSFFFCDSLGSADREADCLVMPAEAFLSAGLDRERPPVIGYGEESLLPLCLGAGAFDYLREPWGLPELEARVRRLRGRGFALAGARCELRPHELRGPLGGVPLSPRAYDALRLLVDHAPRALSAETLHRVIGTKAPSALPMAVSRLRKAIGLAAGGEAASRLRGTRAGGPRADGEAGTEPAHDRAYASYYLALDA